MGENSLKNLLLASITKKSIWAELNALENI